MLRAGSTVAELKRAATLAFSETYHILRNFHLGAVLSGLPKCKDSMQLYPDTHDADSTVLFQVGYDFAMDGLRRPWHLSTCSQLTVVPSGAFFSRRG